MTEYLGGFKPQDRVRFDGMVTGTVADGEFPDIHPMHVPVVFDGSITIHHLHRQDLERIEPEPARLGFKELSGVWQLTGEKFEVMFREDDPVGSFYLRERGGD